jgi:hypothetical protein
MEMEMDLALLHGDRVGESGAGIVGVGDDEYVRGVLDELGKKSAVVGALLINACFMCLFYSSILFYRLKI